MPAGILSLQLHILKIVLIRLLPPMCTIPIVCTSITTIHARREYRALTMKFLEFGDKSQYPGNSAILKHSLLTLVIVVVSDFSIGYKFNCSWIFLMLQFKRLALSGLEIYLYDWINLVDHINKIWQLGRCTASWPAWVTSYCVYVLNFQISSTFWTLYREFIYLFR